MKNKIDFKKAGSRFVGAAAGGAAAYGLNQLLNKMHPMVAAGIKIGIGAIGPEFVPDAGKMKYVKEGVDGLGSGLIAVGTAEIMTHLIETAPAIKGVGEGKEDKEPEFIVDTDKVNGTEGHALGKSEGSALGGDLY